MASDKAATAVLEYLIKVSGTEKLDTLKKKTGEVKKKTEKAVRSMKQKFWDWAVGFKKVDQAMKKGETRTTIWSMKIRGLGQRITKAGFRIGFFGWIASYSMTRLLGVFARLGEFSGQVFKMMFDWTKKLLGSLAKWTEGIQGIAFAMGLLGSVGLLTGKTLALFQGSMQRFMEIGPKYQAIMLGISAVMLSLISIIGEKMLPGFIDLWNAIQRLATSKTVISWVEAVGGAFGRVFTAIGQLLDGIPALNLDIEGMVDAIADMIIALMPVVTAILPVLVQLITALAPAFAGFGAAIVESMPAIEKMIPALVSILEALVIMFPGLIKGISLILQFTAVLFDLLEPWLPLIGLILPVIILIATIAMILGPIITLIGLIIQVVGFLVMGIQALGLALLFLAANPVVLIIAGIVALIIILIWAYNNVEWFRKGVDAAFKFLSSDVVQAILMIISPIFLLIKILQWVAKYIWGSSWVTDFANAMFKLANRVLNAMDKLTGGVTRKITDMARKALDWGKRFAKNLINGMKSGDYSGAAKQVANTIAKFLKISSAPKLGPLSTLEQWGPNLAKTFSRGLLGGIPRLEAAVAKLAVAGVPGTTPITPPIRPGGPTEMTNYIDIQITIGSLSSDIDIDDLTDALDRKLSERLLELTE